MRLRFQDQCLLWWMLRSANAEPFGHCPGRLSCLCNELISAVQPPIPLLRLDAVFRSKVRDGMKHELSRRPKGSCHMAGDVGGQNAQVQCLGSRETWHGSDFGPGQDHALSFLQSTCCSYTTSKATSIDRRQNWPKCSQRGRWS